MAHRNRVIYQSEALFVSPLSTGYHSTGDTIVASGPGAGLHAGKNVGPMSATLAAGRSKNGFFEMQTGTIIQQLKRVQSANYSFTVNRQDVNQFGQLSRIDSLVVDTPTVTMDFSYLPTDGENERLLNFVTDGITNSLSGHIDPEISNAGQNFFILTVPEGKDAYKGDMTKTGSNTVISLGNGYLSDYSLEASVGSFPTVSCTVEGFNIKTDVTTITGGGPVGYGDSEFSGLLVPAIDPSDGSRICHRTFVLPETVTGVGVSALRPGDITLDLANAGLLSKQTAYDGKSQTPTAGSAHVQSVSLSLPMSRSVLQRLGNTFGFSREIDFPISATLTVNALVSEVKQGNMLDIICGNNENDLVVTMRNPECIECNRGSSPTGIMYTLKGAILESESYSSAIGDNKTVDLTWSVQIGGPTDRKRGLFISGSSPYITPPMWKTGNAVADGYFPGRIR